MIRPTSLMAGLLVGALLASAPVLAQTQTKPKCDPSKTPAMIEGQVTKVDMNTNRVTIRAKDGKTHEFETSKETLKDYKVGDTLEARLSSC